jgi:hypothetical protein
MSGSIIEAAHRRDLRYLEEAARRGKFDFFDAKRAISVAGTCGYLDVADFLARNATDMRENAALMTIYHVEHGKYQDAQWWAQFSEDVCQIGVTLMDPLKILRWARSQKPTLYWDEAVCKKAVVIGNLEVLRWLRSQQPPCPWNALECAIAAFLLGHLRMYAWVETQLKAKDKWTARATFRAWAWEALRAGKYASKELAEFLQQTPDMPLSKEFCSNVGEKDHVEAFRVLLEQGRYGRILRSGLCVHGPNCARVARALGVHLDAASLVRAQKVFRKQIVAGCILVTVGRVSTARLLGMCGNHG